MKLREAIMKTSIYMTIHNNQDTTKTEPFQQGGVGYTDQSYTTKSYHVLGSKINHLMVWPVFSLVFLYL